MSSSCLFGGVYCGCYHQALFKFNFNVRGLVQTWDQDVRDSSAVPRGLINCLPQTVVARLGGSGLLSWGTSLYLEAHIPNLWAVSASRSASKEPVAVAASNCSCVVSFEYVMKVATPPMPASAPMLFCTTFASDWRK